jgi:hypothetical protein
MTVMSDGKNKKTVELEVDCPSCRTKLLVDAATGVVLREDRPKKPKKSFENALDEERTRKATSDDLFGKALSSERDRGALLDRKFEKALEKAAEEPDVKPKNPLDWD